MSWLCKIFGHSWKCYMAFQSCCRWCGIDYTEYCKQEEDKMKTQKSNHSQKIKKEVETLSVLTSGDTKQCRPLWSKDDRKLQIERSASSIADNQSSGSSIKNKQNKEDKYG